MPTMKLTKPALYTLLAIQAMPGFAQTPEPARPSIYARQHQIDKVFEELHPKGPAQMPAKGAVQFTFERSSYDSSNDDASPPVLFISNPNGSCRISLSSQSVLDDNGKPKLWFSLQTSDGGNIRSASFKLPDGPQVIKFSWDTAATDSSKKASLTVGGTNIELDRHNNSFCTPTWSTPAFDSWRKDKLTDLTILDADGNPMIEPRIVDLELVYAAKRLRYSLRQEILPKLQNCGSVANNAPCNVATGDRPTILNQAMQLGLGHRLLAGVTNISKAEVEAAAKTYAQRIIDVINKDAENTSTPLSGNDLAAQGRVGALGFIYDWFHEQLTDSERKTYAQAIRTALSLKKYKDGSDSGSVDLAEHICAPNNLVNKSPFTCTTPPALTWNEGSQYTIAESYIAGMNFTTVAQASIGLLATADDRTADVTPMLDILQKHIEKGFLASRAYISVDGASHQGYGYGMADLPKRVQLWRTARNDNTLFPAPWLQKTVFPYLYGLRADGTFPALSDSIGTNTDSRDLAELLAWTIQNGDETLAPYARQFYWSHVVPKRVNVGAWSLLLERMMWPESRPKPAETPSATLPLTRHMRNAGIVLMRDKADSTTGLFDYANSTLLEFKSSSFITLNHHHMDQNSFTLAYKGPLLTDSGVYDSYGSKHGLNYYTRSIAHNTIVVPGSSDEYKLGNTVISNDGGQWFQQGQLTIPTTADIKCAEPNSTVPSGRNCIDGVKFEATGTGYSVVTGDARKVYSPKVTAFLRTVAFLPEGGSAFSNGLNDRPLAIIYDQVQTAGQLPATFLLHTVSQPDFPSATVAEANYGRSAVSFQADASRMFTTQNNGGGLASIRTMLPKNAVLTRVGGNSARDVGSWCYQHELNGTMGQDCRFTVPVRQDGKIVSVNYPPGAKSGEASEGDSQNNSQALRPDASEWRVEVKSPTTPVNGIDQHFLHLIGTGDTSADATPAATVVADNEQCSAVRIGDKLTVVFRKRNAPSDANGNYTLSWESAENEQILVIGLRTSHAHRLETVGGMTRLSSAGTAGSEISSDDKGIIATYSSL